MSIREKFIVTKRYNTIAIAMMVVGLLVRFADRWFSDFGRPAPSEQTVSNLRQPSATEHLHA